jgi:hypothetical protein
VLSTDSLRIKVRPVALQILAPENLSILPILKCDSPAHKLPTNGEGGAAEAGQDIMLGRSTRPTALFYRPCAGEDGRWRAGARPTSTVS